MRYPFFAIATIITTLFSFSPVIAGGNFGDENLGPISECELREILGKSPCRRLTREEAFVLGKTIEALGNIAGAAIVNERYYNRYDRQSPRVRLYEPRRDYRNPGFYTGPTYRHPTRFGIWGDASQYEAETGKICPYGGYKDFIGGRYYCRIR